MTSAEGISSDIYWRRVIVQTLYPYCSLCGGVPLKRSRSSSTTVPRSTPTLANLDTPLQLAVRGGKVETVRVLLKHGAKVNDLPAVLVPAFIECLDEPNEFRPRSALAAAVERGHLELIEMLLEAGAEINGPVSTDGGATALQCAAGKGFLGIARKLIEAGAKVNAPRAEEDGRTALEAAAEWGRLDMVQFMLENGAETEGDGLWQYLRAVGLARKNGHLAVAGLLEDWREWTSFDRLCSKYSGLLDDVFKVPGEEEVFELLEELGEASVPSTGEK